MDNKCESKNKDKEVLSRLGPSTPCFLLSWFSCSRAAPSLVREVVYILQSEEYIRHYLHNINHAWTTCTHHEEPIMEESIPASLVSSHAIYNWPIGCSMYCPVGWSDFEKNIWALGLLYSSRLLQDPKSKISL